MENKAFPRLATQVSTAQVAPCHCPPPADMQRAARLQVIQSLVAIESAVRTLREALTTLWFPDEPGRPSTGL